MRHCYLFIIIKLTLSILSAAQAANICLTGSTVKQFPKYGDAFKNAADLAIKTSKSNNLKILDFFYDRNPSAPAIALKKMIKAKCKAVIGFSTGNDLIAISDLALNSKIPILSIYGDNSQTIIENPYISTIQPSEQYLLTPLFEKLDTKIKTIKKALIVTAIDRNSMMLYSQVYKKLLTDRKIEFKEIMILEKDQNIENLTPSFFKANDFDSLILLTRSALAAKITDITTKEVPDLKLILGTKYFGSSALPAYFNYLKNKNIEAFYSRHNCLCDNDDRYKSFISSYKKEYQATPMVISASTFDLVNFLIENYDSNKSNFNKALNANFKGVTGIKISKGLNISHSKYFVIKVSKNGYNKI